MTTLATAASTLPPFALISLPAVRPRTARPAAPCGKCGTAAGRPHINCKQPARKSGTKWGYEDDLCLKCWEGHYKQDRRESVEAGAIPPPSGWRSGKRGAFLRYVTANYPLGSAVIIRREAERMGVARQVVSYYVRKLRALGEWKWRVGSGDKSLDAAIIVPTLVLSGDDRPTAEAFDIARFKHIAKREGLTPVQLTDITRERTVREWAAPTMAREPHRSFHAPETPPADTRRDDARRIVQEALQDARAADRRRRLAVRRREVGDGVTGRLGALAGEWTVGV
jgi:hypothetical protein